MNPTLEQFALWLADFSLLSGVLLAAVLVALALLRQPVQRLAVAKSALVAILLLAALSALPGWSVVHLFTSPSPPVVAPTAVSDETVYPRTDVRPQWEVASQPNETAAHEPLAPAVQPSVDAARFPKRAGRRRMA